jgi:hypothetical protein
MLDLLWTKWSWNTSIAEHSIPRTFEMYNDVMAYRSQTVWKAMKSIFNLFELPSVLEYQFCENRIAFSIIYLLNCIGI